MKIKLIKNNSIVDEREKKIRIEGDKISSVHILLQSLFVTNRRIRIKNIPFCLDFFRIVNFIEKNNIGKIHIDKEDRSLEIISLKSIKDLSPLNKVSRASIGMISSLVLRNGFLEFCKPGGCTFSERPINAHLNLLKEIATLEYSASNNYYIANRLSTLPPKINCNCYTGCTSSIGVFFNSLLMAYSYPGEISIYGFPKESSVKEMLSFLSLSTNRTYYVKHNHIIIRKVDKIIFKNCEYSLCPDTTMAMSYILLNYNILDTLSLKGITTNCFINSQIEFLEKIGIKLIDDQRSVKLIKKDIDIIEHPLVVRFGQYPDMITDLNPIITSFLATKNIESLIVDYTYSERYSHIPPLNSMGISLDILNKGIVGHTNNKNCIEIKENKIQAPDIRAGMAIILSFMLNSSYKEIIIENFEQILRGYGNVLTMLNKVGVKFEKCI